MKSENKYKREWEKLEEIKPAPYSFRKVCEMDYSEFEYQVKTQSDDFVKNITSSLYSGDFIILKNAFSQEYVNQLKLDIIEYSKKSPSSFHKMKEECPDFHRIQNEDQLGKYSVDAVRHSFYFFTWNDDPLKIRKKIYEKWRIIKFASGRSPTEWEKNTPKDGVVDRIQIVKYPLGAGYIEPHVHDPINQRISISVFMSELGKDYSEGGCYFFNKEDQMVSVESKIKTGDIGLFYGSVRHCVEPVEVEESMQKNIDTDGRWWMGLYSPESDESDTRHTSSRISV